jgi:multidrug efflux pump subunit AcrB
VVEGRLRALLRGAIAKPWISGIVAAGVFVLAYLLFISVPFRACAERGPRRRPIIVQLPEGASYEETVGR